MNQIVRMPAAPSTTYPVPLNEVARSQTLQEVRVLDSQAKNAFDSAVRQAASICGTPIAEISRIDRDRLWFKSRVGLEAQEAPRQLAFFTRTILGEQLFEVPNALADERFVDNPRVTADPHTRFSAGMPLNTADGMGMGSRGVIDRDPRQLNVEQRESMHDLVAMVTAMLESRKTAAESTQLSLMLNEAFDEIIVLYPDSQHIQYANAAALENLGYRLRDLQQMPFLGIGAGYVANLPQLSNDQAPMDRNTMVFEAEHTRKDGSTYPVEVRATVSSSRGMPQVILLANDISARKNGEERLRRLATCDSVTHLANRRSFEVSLACAMRNARCSGKVLALVMIEIDRLADIRHVYGQQVADQALAEFAARLKKCARPGDLVAHLGGDEFVVLIEGVVDAGAMSALAAQIHGGMEREFLWAECRIPLSASVGAVYFSGGDEGADAFLARGADAVSLAVVTGVRQQIMPLTGLNAPSRLRTPSLASVGR